MVYNVCRYIEEGAEENPRFVVKYAMSHQLDVGTLRGSLINSLFIINSILLFSIATIPPWTRCQSI